MDLRAQLVGVDVPLFEIGNIVDASSLLPHIYDLREDTPVNEPNGLVYTCRGGWIDTAHVRETSDLVFFLARSLVPRLATGATMELPARDTATTLVLHPVAQEVLDRLGPTRVATILARWIAFRIAIWHEATTWYGYESVPGFSERLSAFSIEDLYSDALGGRIGGELAERRDVATVSDYEAAMGIALPRVLDRLGAQPVERSRAVMAALDGRWWTSTRRVPDVLLVTHRALPDERRETWPWLVADAFDEDLPSSIADVCPGAIAHERPVPDHVDDVSIRSLVDIEWRPGAWADGILPFEDRTERVFRERDLSALVAATRQSMRLLLGDGFDEPRAP